jgi:hypothetical protein
MEVRADGGVMELRKVHSSNDELPMQIMKRARNALAT